MDFTAAPVALVDLKTSPGLKLLPPPTIHSEFPSSINLADHCSLTGSLNQSFILRVNIFRTEL